MADNFEKQLEESQRLLGIAEAERVPVLYAQSSSAGQILMSMAPIALTIVALYYMSKNMLPTGRGGGGIFNVGKSTAKRFEKQSVSTKFADVAGCDEAKMEVMEFVEFLRNPQRFERLGAKSPKGALLVGPPGVCVCVCVCVLFCSFASSAFVAHPRHGQDVVGQGHSRRGISAILLRLRFGFH